MGAHQRWCAKAVGRRASVYGPMSEQLEEMGDRVGSNNTGIANRLYLLSSDLRKWATERPDSDNQTLV